MKTFFAVINDVELALDIVGTLEEGGHRVVLADTLEVAMASRPLPDALIVDAHAEGIDEDVRAWARREQVPMVVIGPRPAEHVARRIGAAFVERPAASVGTVRRTGPRATHPDPLWPLVLLETAETAATTQPRRGAFPSLPEEARALERPRESVAAASEHWRGPILVVEDDDAIRNSILEVLSEEGFRVLGASDGLEALEVLSRRELPRLILLDLMMPRMNGWELHEALARDARLRDVPIVVISVLAPARELAPPRVRAQLHKPMKLNELVETVDRLVEDDDRRERPSIPAG